MNPITNVWLSADGRARRKGGHQVLMMKGIILAVLVVVLVIASSAAWHFLSPSGDAKKNPKDNNLTASSDAKNTENTSAGETESETGSETETEGTSDPIAEARLLAAGYDYDGAIDLLKSDGFLRIKSPRSWQPSEFETTKASCVAVDVTTVPHIFYPFTDQRYNSGFRCLSPRQQQDRWHERLDDHCRRV